MTALFLVGGGVRSGKSDFARWRAERLGQRRVLIATAEPKDEEMAARIARHRAERDASWQTIEAPLELRGAIESLPPCDVVLIDCLTLWLSNRLLQGHADDEIIASLEEVIALTRRRAVPLGIVTNEVGLGIVPENALARRFRDLSGRAHRRVAASADEVYVALLGVVLRLRPGPIEEATWGG